MKSKAVSTFWKRYDRLPLEVRKLAWKNFRLWLANPRHPSLHFKPFRENFWSARVGDHYRVVGYHRDPNTFVWTWIGTHEEYNKF
jgi:hypothetical protein